MAQVFRWKYYGRDKRTDTAWWIRYKDADGRDREESDQSGEHQLGGERAPLGRRMALGGKAIQNLIAAGRGQLEEACSAQRLAAHCCELDLLRADAAGREVSRDLLPPRLRKLFLDVLEELAVVWVRSGHHALGLLLGRPCSQELRQPAAAAKDA